MPAEYPLGRYKITLSSILSQSKMNIGALETFSARFSFDENSPGSSEDSTERFSDRELERDDLQGFQGDSELQRDSVVRNFANAVQGIIHNV